MKFIRVHKKGVEVLVNFDHIAAVVPIPDGRTQIVYIEGSENSIDESYEEICLAIGEAQGTLPLRNYKKHGQTGV